MLVNAHTHLELGVFAHLRPEAAGSAFVPWVQALVKARWDIAGEGLLPFQKAVERGIEVLRSAGTTVVGDISTSGVSVEPLLTSGLRGVVYYEVLGLVAEEALARLDAARLQIEAWRKLERPGGARVGLSIHAPYSCHPDLFREGAAWCVAEKAPLCVHAAESPAEAELLRHGSGPFHEMQRSLNLPDLPMPGVSPIAYLEDLGVLAARPLLVHAVEVDEEDIRRIARAGARVVHCPRSNRLLQCNRMPLEKYLAAGVPVALGTDSLASSPSLDVRQEAEAAIALHAGRVAPETIRGLLHVGHPFC